MILLKCPCCGERNVSEFRYGGEARTRPDVNAVTEQDWAHYLYMRENPSGEVTEWWYHAAGCGRWFLAKRHTKTHVISATYFPETEAKS